MKLIKPQPAPPSDAFIQRLINFFHNQPAADMSQIWQGVTAVYQARLANALVAKDVRDTAEVLEHAYDNGIVWGLDLTYPDMQKDEQAYISWWKKQLGLLAHMTGTLPVNNPEQPVSTEYDCVALVRELERVIGMPFYHPGGGNRPCLELDGRSIPAKLINAAAIFWVVQSLPNSGHGVLEIGAGTGLNADILYRPFHTIDLPLTSVIQAYLLETSNGDGFVSFHGEAGEGAIIHGLHKPSEQFSLVLNQDSMPEMTLPQANGYLDYIEEHLVKEGCFVSINHESNVASQNRVFGLMQNRTSFKLLQRSPWWLREGYLLEIWKRL